MKTAAKVGALAMIIALSFGGGAGVQGLPAGDPALVVSVSGQVAIVNEGRATTQGVLLPYVGSTSTTQQYDLDITLPVLGLPIRGQASVQMATRATTIVVVPDIHSTGQAQNITLRGPAGDATVSIKVDQPMQGLGSYDPAEATVYFRGTGGTGMFDGVNLAGALKGFFRPTGTMYLTYPSSSAALDAVRRGLAQNTTVSDAQRLTALEQATQALAQAKVATFPPDDATQAVVTPTIQRNGSQVRVMVRIVVPAGEGRQAVKVVSVGADGHAQTVYQGVHAPGETVSASTTGTPPFVLQVYVGGALVKQITVPAG